MSKGYFYDLFEVNYLANNKPKNNIQKLRKNEKELNLKDL